MPKCPPPDNDDLAFFKQAMKGIKRSKPSLYHPKRNKLSSLHSSHLKKEISSAIEGVTLILADPYEQGITAADRLFFSRSGLQAKQIKQLIAGKIAESDYLDLHHMTVEQARLAVVNFLLQSRQQSYRCVRIIHGKGHFSKSGAKLKNYVNYWLAQIPWILAFCSAQAKDGGTGAVYVLLRRH